MTETLIAHVGCGSVDERGHCERCEAIRAILRASEPLEMPDPLTGAEALTVMLRNEMTLAENYHKEQSGVLRFLIHPWKLNALLRHLAAAAASSADPQETPQ